MPVIEPNSPFMLRQQIASAKRHLEHKSACAHLAQQQYKVLAFGPQPTMERGRHVQSTQAFLTACTIFETEVIALQLRIKEFEKQLAAAEAEEKKEKEDE